MKKKALLAGLLPALFLFSCTPGSSSSPIYMSNQATQPLSSSTLEEEAATTASSMSSLDPHAGMKLLTGNLVDGYALSDGAIILLWGWGGDISGVYYATEANESTLTAYVDEEVIGVKAVRYDPAKAPEAGSTTYQSDGIWNETGDIDVTSSTSFDIDFIEA